ncbi:hypothetical protein HAALTHF_11960n [Vreelandella aquamarina]|nr:hypothetical protein HAALTHF_11960n [Halomonas axialensis]
MTLAIVATRAGVGLEAPAVHVEVHLANGLPGLTLVGLPETAVKESRERVRSALINAGFDFPNTKRITLNLAPADLPKEGGRFDLPIALGILAASGQIPVDALEGMECAGELALDGKLRAVPGVLPFALATRRANKALIVPRACADEAALAGDLPVLPADSLASGGSLTGPGENSAPPALRLRQIYRPGGGLSRRSRPASGAPGVRGRCCRRP